MGCSIGMSSGHDYKNCDCNCKTTPNPNPWKFEILRTKVIGDFIVAEIKYPDCTNFEGVKILVYENVSLKKLSVNKYLDPHFGTSKSDINPIARFVPTPIGWARAISFVKMLAIEKMLEKL